MIDEVIGKIAAVMFLVLIITNFVMMGEMVKGWWQEKLTGFFNKFHRVIETCSAVVCTLGANAVLGVLAWFMFFVAFKK